MALKPRPSSAARWVPCPASVALEARYPDDGPPSPARAEGIAAHEYLALHLAGVAPAIGDMLGNGLSVTREMVEGAEMFAKDLADFVVPPEALQVEQSLALTSVREDCVARPDFFYVDVARRVVCIWDYKFGHRYVDAFDNWQLALYAAAIAEHHQLEHDWQVRICVVQPRCYSDMQRVRYWMTDIATVMHKALVASRSARRIGDVNAEAATGPQCLDCRAKRGCRAFQAVSQWACDVAADASPRDLSSAELAAELRILQTAAERLKGRIVALEAQAVQEIKLGKHVPGYHLEQARTNEKWTVPDEEVLALGAMLGVDLAKPASAMTPKQARDAGVDESVVAAYSMRPQGELRLKALTDSKIAKIFQKG